MRAFIVLCLVALSAADVSELFQDGYNYHQPSGQGSGFDLGSATDQGPSFANVAMRMSVPMRPEFGYEPVESMAPETVSKRFFTYTAQDSDDDEDDSEVGSAGGNRNYDVVFANAPKPSLNSALKAVANFAGQQQTAVYVLSKTLGAGEIGHALRRSGIKPNKPQVHFIKYKTPEEAEHAQHHIRAQYDGLGGPSEFHNEGSAPVRSFVGALGHRSRGPSRGRNGAAHRPSSNYLPPSRYLPPRY